MAEDEAARQAARRAAADAKLEAMRRAAEQATASAAQLGVAPQGATAAGWQLLYSDWLLCVLTVTRLLFLMLVVLLVFVPNHGTDIMSR